jgi:hypothetical protein
MLSAALIIIVMLGVLMYFIVQRLPAVDPVRTILLGIAVILIGGIIIMGVDAKLGGLQYLIPMFGLILALTGFFKD